MVDSFNLHSIQLVLLILLLIVAAVAGLARRLNISYPIVLVLTGVLAGFLPHPVRLPLAPDFVFLVFLPPLLFAAAWQTSWRDFKRNLISISMLALGLVAVTVWVAAEFANQFIPEFDWRAGFLLGAVVSPTDAIAATSIARRLGLPRRIVDVLEGESLVNDATGLLALELGIELVRGDAAPSVGTAAFRLVWLVVGGVITGLAIGYVVRWFERWINDGPVEIMITMIVPFATYLAGESAHTSGVIAVVACGLYLGRNSVSFFSAETRLQANSTWDVLNFLLNGLVFVLIGLQLPFVLAGIRGYSLRALIGYGVAFSGVLIAVRMAWVYTFAPVATFLARKLHDPERPMPTSASKFVVGWTGMRGVISLAAAVSIPYGLRDSESPSPVRNIIVFLTFVVIFVTLVVQGLALPPLVRLLRLGNQPDTDCEEGDARAIMIRAAITFLKNARQERGHDAEHAAEDLLHQYEHRLESLTGCGPAGEAVSHSVLDVLALEAVQVERGELIKLRDEDRISDETLRVLERELDLSESRLAPIVTG